MKKLTFESNFKLIKELILKDEVICSPTDTLYGLIGNALSEKAVEKVYKVKGRDPQKPLIILFDSISRAKEYGIKIEKHYEKKLQNIWPERLTAIFQLEPSSPFRKIFQGDNIAVRIPKFEPLIKLVKETVPLFAPSANPQGLEPAKSCKECKEYFEGKINFCIEGKSHLKPSTIIDFTTKTPKIIREGIIDREKISQLLTT